jgi:predicted AlkP superfamily phosphohydrolase/phosphomutase
MKPRSVIVGIDGATWDLLTPWIEAGYLPAFKQLIKEGTSGRIHAWPTTNSASAWSTMVTGVNPGIHGIYNFGRFLPGREEPLMRGALRRRPAFWDLLDAQDQRVIVFNVPITYPATRLKRGAMISGMDAPGIDSPGFTHPPDLLVELQQEGIDYILDIAHPEQEYRKSPNELPEVVRKMTEASARTFLHFMHKHPWDVLMGVFIGSDRMQHYYWLKDEPPLSPLWKPLLDLYQQYDSFLAELLASIDDATNLLVVSDHGFGYAWYPENGLSPLFYELGLQVRRKKQPSLIEWGLTRVLVTGRRLLPPALQHRLALAFPKLRQRAVRAHDFADIDWAQTQAFTTRFGSEVFINRAGYYPQGSVQPEDYETVLLKIIEILKALKDADTGKRLIRSVKRGSEVFHGPFLAKAADLIIEWEEDNLGDSIRYEGPYAPQPVELREDPLKRKHDPITGRHCDDGIVIGRGSAFREGGEIANAKLSDIAATVLYLQDATIPDDLDGEVLVGMMRADYVEAHPVRRTPLELAVAESEPVLVSDEDNRIVETRLRDLGYIE